MATFNLGDMQALIDHGEYLSHPLAKSNPFYVCPLDGTVLEQADAACPNPFHPHPRPKCQRLPSPIYIMSC